MWNCWFDCFFLYMRFKNWRVKNNKTRTFMKNTALILRLDRKLTFKNNRTHINKHRLTLSPNFKPNFLTLILKRQSIAIPSLKSHHKQPSHIKENLETHFSDYRHYKSETPTATKPISTIDNNNNHLIRRRSNRTIKTHVVQAIILIYQPPWSQPKRVRIRIRKIPIGILRHLAKIL